MKKIILAAMFLLVAGCTNEDQAKNILSAQGYNDITFTGYNFFACSEDDFYHTGFVATSPAGVSVSGTVCSGLFFKGATIRY